MFQEALGALILQSAHRNHREILIQLNGRHGIARIAADEGLLEIGMRDGFPRTHKARAKLHTCSPHFQIGKDRLTAPNPAGHEHRHIADMGQDFLREYGQRNRADMPACLTAFNHQRIGPGADKALGKREGRRKAHHLRPAILGLLDRGARRNAARENNMRNLSRQAGIHQLIQPWMHGDQIDAKGLACQYLCSGDFFREPRRFHRPAGNHAKGPGIGQRGYQMPFTDPGHGAAQNGITRAQKRCATRHQPIKLRQGLGHVIAHAGASNP